MIGIGLFINIWLEVRGWNGSSDVVWFGKLCYISLKIFQMYFNLVINSKKWRKGRYFNTWQILLKKCIPFGYVSHLLKFKCPWVGWLTELIERKSNPTEWLHVWAVGSYSSGNKLSYLILDDWCRERTDRQFKPPCHPTHLPPVVIKYVPSVSVIIFSNSSNRKFNTNLFLKIGSALGIVSSTLSSTPLGLECLSSWLLFVLCWLCSDGPSGWLQASPVSHAVSSSELECFISWVFKSKHWGKLCMDMLAWLMSWPHYSTNYSGEEDASSVLCSPTNHVASA